MTMEFINFLARWGHGLFGITWIGMLYYFNFIQGAYFKEASPEGLADAKAKLAPRALWWFRWGAMFTFITGIILFGRCLSQCANEQLHYYWCGYGYANGCQCMDGNLASTKNCFRLSRWW